MIVGPRALQNIRDLFNALQLGGNINCTVIESNLNEILRLIFS